MWRSVLAGFDNRHASGEFALDPRPFPIEHRQQRRVPGIAASNPKQLRWLQPAFQQADEIAVLRDDDRAGGMLHDGGVARPPTQRGSRVFSLMPFRPQLVREQRGQLRIDDETHHSAANAILLFAVRAA